MAEISKVSPDVAANAISWQAADSGGDSYVNDGDDILMVNHTNDAGSSVTLTITTTKTIEGLSVSDRTITIGAGEFHILGPYKEGYYSDADGKVQLSWSAATDIELAVLD